MARSSASLAALTPSRRDGEPLSISSRLTYHDGHRSPQRPSPSSSPRATPIADDRRRTADTNGVKKDRKAGPWPRGKENRSLVEGWRRATRRKLEGQARGARLSWSGVLVGGKGKATEGRAEAEPDGMGLSFVVSSGWANERNV